MAGEGKKFLTFWQMIRFFHIDSRKTVHRVCTMLLCAVLLVGFSAGVRAENVPGDPIRKAGLLDLARKMVDTVGKKLETAKRQEEERKNPLGRVEDGETLIFTVWLNGKTPIEGEIVMTKEGKYLLASLRDFINTLRFPIQFDGQTYGAEGWYINEQKLFSLDWDARQVVADGRTFDLSSLVRQEGDDLMIPLPELEAWFGLSMRPEVASLIVDLRSQEKLPLELRLARRKQKEFTSSAEQEASLPPLDNDYKMIDVPVVDMSSSVSYRRPPKESDGKATTAFGSTLQAEGDVLQHTGHVFVTGNKEDKISSARVSLSKSDPDPVLLGKLGARHYEVGDVVLTDMPLLGSGAQELGARVTNKDASGRTSYTTKTFTGDLPPGWDVELYQNEQLIGFLTVEEDGIYRFEDVALFAGENDFRFVFYGPQGEYREEDVSIPVNLAELEGSGGTYDVSVSVQETPTYIARDEDPVEAGKVAVAATYEQVFAQGLSGIAGFRHRAFGEEQKTHFLTGVSAALGGGLLTSNLGYDIDSQAGLDTNYRISLGRHDVSTGLYFATDEFSPTSVSENPTTFGTRASVKGPLLNLGRYPVDYSLFGSFNEDASGESITNLKQNFSTNIDGIRLNHTLDYFGPSAEGADDQLSSLVSASGTAFKGLRWRARADYQYKPESTLTDTYFELSKKIHPEVTAVAELEHRPEARYTKGTLRANWQTMDQIITPQVSLDSEDELRATISTRYGLIRDPRTGDIDRTRQRQTGSGAVSAFVFLDKNGDNIFNGEDEPIEGARVDAVQSRRYAETDANGVALVQGLPEQKRTDVTINGLTLGDPYWIPGSAGQSIVPRPGNIPTIDFPVHNSGEMDGTIWFEKNDTKRPARNIRLSLVDQSGKTQSSIQTAYDGFYIFTTVPPGTYYLTFDPDDLKSVGVSAPPPQKVSFGYEGTILYGQDFVLKGMRGQGITGFTVAEGIGDIEKRHPHVAIPVLGEGTPLFNLGQYQSQLMMSLVLFRMKNQYPGLMEGLRELVKPSESLPDLKTNKYTLRLVGAGVSSEDAYRRCRSLSARGISCTVELLPKGYTPSEHAENTF